MDPTFSSHIFFSSPSCFFLLGSPIGLPIRSPSCEGRDDNNKKTLVIETISKSPTLAYLLAVQHFDTTSGRPTTTMPSSTLPGAAMVTLAVLGACVASVWSLLTPRHTAEAAATATVGTNISKKKKSFLQVQRLRKKKKKQVTNEIHIATSSNNSGRVPTG